MQIWLTVALLKIAPGVQAASGSWERTWHPLTLVLLPSAAALAAGAALEMLALASPQPSAASVAAIASLTRTVAVVGAWLRMGERQPYLAPVRESGGPGVGVWRGN